MADLNELSKFEKDLKNLIESRNNLTPHYMDVNRITRELGEQTLMVIGEHGQPYKINKELPSTRMCVGEHGQPYKTPRIGAVTSYMVVREHGQPFRK